MSWGHAEGGGPPPYTKLRRQEPPRGGAWPGREVPSRSRSLPGLALCLLLLLRRTGEQPLTARLLPRKACRKADLPAPLAPSTLQRKTFLWVWPFSRSILFSRVTARRGAG